MENHKRGRPKKLTTVDERAIISQSNIGKAENAIEVAKNLNSIINNHVLILTIQNILKKCNMKAKGIKKIKGHYYLPAIGTTLGFSSKV